MSFAFVFPGQGSQSVGMLGALATAESAVRATFDEASRALGFDLWKLVSEGPEEALNATERTQPAMLAAGVAVWRVWRARGGALPEVVCGHSLGEFTALVCAEGLPFGATVELVRLRGAAERLRERLHSLEVRAPRIRYVSAVDASAHERPDEIRELLVRQLSSPVRWTDTLRAVSAGAVAQVIECGPGKVLTGLNRRIERRADLDFLALEDPSSIEAALAATRGGSHA